MYHIYIYVTHIHIYIYIYILKTLWLSGPASAIGGGLHHLPESEDRCGKVREATLRQSFYGAPNG